MGRPTLESVDLKLNAAKDRFDALTKLVSEFVTEPGNSTLSLEQHPKRGGIFRVADVRRPPPEWGILIGDCVHHYRSALDHLAFQLLVGNSRGRLSAQAVRRSEFPIFNSGPKFRGKRKRSRVPAPGSGRGKIQGIPLPAQAAIERLQPYHRRKNPDSRALWQLQELANIDKHRLLHVTYASIRGSTFTVTHHRNVAAIQNFNFRPGALKRDAVVAEWQIAPADPRYGTELNVEAEMLTDIVFGQASPARAVRGQPVVKTLYDIGAFIASDVLPPLTGLLGLNSNFKPGKLIDLEKLSIEERDALGERTLVQNLNVG